MTARLVGYMMRTALQSRRKLEQGRTQLARHPAPSRPSRPRCGNGVAPWAAAPEAGLGARGARKAGLVLLGSLF